MIEEQGRVVELDGDLAWVETRRQSACGACSANKACGTAVLDKVMGNRVARVRAVNRAGATVGDEVTIGMRESALVRGSLAVYLVPLATMMLAGLLGETLAARLAPASSEAAAVVFALGGFGIGLWWLRGFNRRVQRDARYQPVVLRCRAPAAVPVAPPGGTTAA